MRTRAVCISGGQRDLDPHPQSGKFWPLQRIVLREFSVLMTPREMEEFLGISERTRYRYMECGVIHWTTLDGIYDEVAVARATVIRDALLAGHKLVDIVMQLEPLEQPSMIRTREMCNVLNIGSTTLRTYRSRGLIPGPESKSPKMAWSLESLLQAILVRRWLSDERLTVQDACNRMAALSDAERRERLGQLCIELELKIRARDGNGCFICRAKVVLNARSDDPQHPVLEHVPTDGAEGALDSLRLCHASCAYTRKLLRPFEIE